MSKVDQRVVEIKFDNDQFERAVSTTMATLDALNKSLQLKGAAQGIADLTKVADGVRLGNIEDGVNHIASAFSAMGAIAFTVLQNITNAAINFGKSAISSVIDPIFQGGLNRALNIEQAKFQFQGLGIDVTTAMQSAKDAVLGTAFGLDSAAKAAAMFGASGLQAGPQMTSALRAVAGVAALTGSSFDDIANIFTTISGNGRLMSQELLQFSARGINAAAILAKQLGLTEAQVRTMVTDGKISFTTFFQAMDAALGAHAKDAGQLFSGAMANVHAALARLGADIETPKIDAMRDALNASIPVIDAIHAALMPAIDALGKADAALAKFAVNKLATIDLSALKLSVPLIVDGIANIKNALFDIAKPIGQAFRDIFPEPTVAQIVRVVQAIDDFTKRIKIGATASNEIRRTFAGLFAVLDIGLQIVFQIGKLLGRLFGVMFDGSGNLLELTAKIGDFLVMVDQAIKQGTLLGKVFQFIGDVLEIPIKLLHALTAGLNALFNSNIRIDTTPIEKFAKALDPFERFSMIASEIWDRVAFAIQVAFHALGPFGDEIIKVIQSFGKHIADAFGGDFSKITDSINTGLFAVLIGLLAKFEAGGLRLGTRNIKLVAQVGQVLTGLRTTLVAWQVELKAETLLKIATALAVLAISVIALSLVDSVALTKSLTAITAMFAQLIVSMALFEKSTSKFGVLKMQSLAISLIFLAIAIDLLVISVVALSKLSWEELAKGILGLAAMLAIVVGTMRLMPNQARMISTAIGLGILAVAIRILVGAVSDLGNLTWDQMIRGLVGVGAVLVALALFTKFSTVNAASAVSTVGLVLLAVAIRILADALVVIGSMSWGDMIKAVIALAVVIAIITTALDGISPSAILGGAGVLLVALSLQLIGQALNEFAKMGWANIASSIVVLLLVLTIISAALDVIPPYAPLSAAGILITAVALILIGTALQEFAKLSWANIFASVVILLAVFTIIGIALTLMIAALPGAIAMLVVAAALVIIAGVLEVFAHMSWSEIGKGLLTLFVALMTLGGVSLILAPLIPLMIGLGIAVALIGAGFALAGVGVFLFAAGMTALSVAGAAGSVALATMLTAIINLIPTFVKALGDSLIILLDVLTKAIPELVDLLVNLLLQLLQGIIKIAPQLSDAILVLLDDLLQLLIKAIPAMTDAGYKILIGILNGIANNIGGVVAAAVSIIVNFIEALGNNLPRIVQAGFDMIINFINGLTKAINDNSEAMGKAGGDLAVAIVHGMITGLGAGTNEIVNAATGLARSALNAAKKFLGIASPSKAFAEVGKFSAMGFALALIQYSTLVSDAATGVGEDAISSLQDSLSGVAEVINASVDPNPTITPVLDLSQLKNDAATIDGILAATPLSVSTSLTTAQAVSADVQANQDQAAINAAANAPGTTVNFTQNNNSPKELNTADIYRQTNNQLQTAKGGVLVNA